MQPLQGATAEVPRGRARSRRRGNTRCAQTCQAPNSAGCSSRGLLRGPGKINSACSPNSACSSKVQRWQNLGVSLGWWNVPLVVPQCLQTDSRQTVMPSVLAQKWPKDSSIAPQINRASEIMLQQKSAHESARSPPPNLLH